MTHQTASLTAMFDADPSGDASPIITVRFQSASTKARLRKSGACGRRSW
jgi:hypothetical protein